MDYLTKDQIDVLKQEIDILISNKYQSTKTELVRDSTLQELEKRKGDLENWKLEIENLRELHLTLAYEPTRTNILTFSNWTKKNVAEDVILDINVDQRIVGGAQIVWNGKYQDYSLTEIVYADLQRLLS